jgi:disulfide bond formation protein DsbB
MDARLQQSSGPDAWIGLARREPIASAAALIAIGSAATILGAWLFQYGLGLKPCPLCLEQRYAYYFAVPLAVFVLMGHSVGSQRKVLLAALAVITAGMLWNAGLATYHAGVEWKLWTGPRDCSGELESLGTANDFLRQLESINVVRCDEAAWRFLGVSLAGYNVVISLALAAIAAWGFVAGYRRPETD